MIVDFHRDFRKALQKMPTSIHTQFLKRLGIFMMNPQSEILKNHALKGVYLGKRSINITGDIRVIYEHIGPQTVIFLIIDTHSELYG